MLFLATLLLITGVNTKVLLWSNYKFQVSPFQPFEDGNLEELKVELGYPKVSIYKTSSSFLPEFERVVKGYQKSFITNADISAENATDITTHEELDALESKQQLEASQNLNILSVLVIPDERYKRDTIPGNSTDAGKTPTGEVLYKIQSKKEVYGMIYSTKPLTLKTNASSLLLGRTSADMITMDWINKDAFTRISVKIPIEDGNLITLRFVFGWYRGYWNFTAVKISDTNHLYDFNLSIVDSVPVPARFSYHCSGETVFTDSKRTAELVIADLQVQIDAMAGRFNDAYDCVSFVTIPIWSGLFITFILGIGLVAALIMITDIKTMDKFDTQKTKQLSISVFE